MGYRTSSVRIGEHLHVFGVDGRIDDNPGTAAEFAVRWNVDDDWLSVLPKTIDNVRAEFHHLHARVTVLEITVYLIEHVLHTSTESTPIGKDEQWQSFATKVLDRLTRLVGGVGEPNLSRLIVDARLAVHRRRVGRDFELDTASLHCDHTARDATETCSSRLKLSINEPIDPSAQPSTNQSTDQSTQSIN